MQWYMVESWENAGLQTPSPVFLRYAQLADSLLHSTHSTVIDSDGI